MAVVDLIVLLRVEDPAERWSHSEHGEIVPRDHLRKNALGLVVDADGGRDQPAAQHLRQRLRLRW